MSCNPWGMFHFPAHDATDHNVSNCMTPGLSRTTYHHGIVIVLCYCQIIGRTPMSWLLMTMNMCVHICEYWTYFQQRRAKESVLKSWLVTLRVTEFTIGSSKYYPFPWLTALKKGRVADASFRHDHVRFLQPLRIQESPNIASPW